MSWSVRIVDLNQKGVSHKDLELEFSALRDLAESAVLLRGIDPYDDTVFNSTQLETLLREWDHRTPHVPASDSPAWEKVREYIVSALKNHLYLKFIGD